MSEGEKEAILIQFKSWFRDSLIASHLRNTAKLKDIRKFNINPFTAYYLANFLEGNSKPESLAKVLLYPRILGTSITTSFGTHMQSFITNVLVGAHGSKTHGLDIEFMDLVDNRMKYCQLKSGPNAINKDDVKTIKDHFMSVKNLARTNNTRIDLDDLVFCLIYGEQTEKNSFIKELEKEYTVFMGKEFWLRFTGDIRFYSYLIEAAGEVAMDVNKNNGIDEIINELSKTIEERFRNIQN